MMIATYKRDHLLPDLLTHLTTIPPPSLRHILIIWQNIDQALPSILQPDSLSEITSGTNISISIRLSKINSMNERFRPILDWDTPLPTEAVMIMDDDVVLRKETLEWGFQQFLAANPAGSPAREGRITGFTGRDWEFTEEQGWGYVVQPQKTYSMVLSNAAWFRKEWLERYWQEDAEMVGLRNYVDEVFNCDDILINYIVSNLTGKPPLLLQPTTPLRTVPTKSGLWNRGQEEDEFGEMDQPVPTPSSTAFPGLSLFDPPPPPAQMDHFTQRLHCLSHYFSHFSKFAPATSPSPSYPLIRTSTSASQDVVDRARWLSEGEPWEAQVWSVVKEMTQEELERERVDDLLDDMSEEELDELLESLRVEERDDMGLQETGDEEEEDMEETADVNVDARKEQGRVREEQGRVRDEF
ncbi:hypothetical protein P7C70_g4426, partial [Phenoliferia sp. Uapishka_3]